MKTIRITAAILFFTSILFSCESNNKNLFEVNIIEENGKKKMTFLPNFPFEKVLDSAQFLFNNEDYQRLINSTIKIAPPIYKNETFNVRVFNRSIYRNNKFTYGFLVRTYTKDGKIKDERVLASTLGGLNCEGRVTSDLQIITSCPDGKETIAQIEYDGSIKLIENE